MLKGKKIGFIGGGAIAEAIVRGILQKGIVSPEQITISDVAAARLEYLAKTFHVAVTTDTRQLAGQVDFLFLTVKPQVIDTVLDLISSAVPKTTSVVSVAAGVTLARLEAKLAGVPVVRVMPNTPVAVGEGMAALALGSCATELTGQMALSIFSAVGKAILLDESAMDAVTGLSGSGPGYVFVMIDALADAGVRAGLSRQNAILLAAQTVLGSAKMVLETGEHPAKLRDMVTSPGGTTIAGIHVMEDRGVRAALSEAVMAATNRSREMGKK